MKKDVEPMKKTTSWKLWTSEIKHTLEGINSSLDEAEDQTRDMVWIPSDKVKKNNQSNKKKIEFKKQG